MRYAIYYIPAPEQALTKAAAAWLRRDPYSGATIDSAVEGLTGPDHAFLTALPRRYGFHATIKAPFRLAEGRTSDELEDELTRFCGAMSPVGLALQLHFFESFFALVPAGVCAELKTLADRVVVEFDRFRSPLSEADIARRDVSRLNGRQLSNLLTWGYPSVLDEFRFHMTLTGPVPLVEREHVELVLRRHFAGLTETIVEISQLVLAVEPEPNAPFLVHSTHQFTQMSERRIA